MLAEKENIERYREHLQAEERSAATQEKYLRVVSAFLDWIGGEELTKERVAAWKRRQEELGFAPSSINSMLSAVNGFLCFIGREDCRVKFLKIQRRIFRGADEELTREDLDRLVKTAAAQGRDRLALLLEAIASTGIRVSEVRYLTVEAARVGRVNISMKGKVRVVLIQKKLCRKLVEYARRNKIRSGEIFRTGSGRGLSRTQIWSEMKSLCGAAGVEPSKVYPHNLRHLFARMFYALCGDIVRVADVLGHSSVETTRIYLISTGEEHARLLEKLELLISPSGKKKNGVGGRRKKPVPV